MREYHVRFCERLGVKFPRPTHLYATGLGKRVQPRIMSYDGCGEVAHCGD